MRLYWPHLCYPPAGTVVSGIPLIWGCGRRVSISLICRRRSLYQYFLDPVQRLSRLYLFCLSAGIRLSYQYFPGPELRLLCQYFLDLKAQLLCQYCLLVQLPHQCFPIRWCRCGRISIALIRCCGCRISISLIRWCCCRGVSIACGASCAKIKLELKRNPLNNPKLTKDFFMRLLECFLNLQVALIVIFLIKMVNAILFMPLIFEHKI